MQPREWQREVLEAAVLAPWIAIAACRKAGKTRLAAIICLWWLATRAESLVVTIAPVWSQVTQGIWANIRTLWQRSRLPIFFPRWNVLQEEIQTGHPLWRAVGFSAADASNLEGRHDGGGGVLVILDESKGINTDFFESIQGMLDDADSESKLLAIGTPGPPRGWFYEAFGPKRDLWGGAVFRIRSRNIPRLRARYAKRLARLGETNPWFLQQEEAEFAGADEFSVFPLTKIEDAIRRELPTTGSAKWPTVLALDPAGRGADDSVLSHRHGPYLMKQMAWQGWDEMLTARFTADQTVAYRDIHDTPKTPDFLVVDTPGLGGPIASRIQQILREVQRRKGKATRVIRYNPSGKARNSERYANRKTEDLFAWRDRFVNDDTSIPDEAMLVAHLSSYRWVETAGGKTKVEDDDGDSPDYGDSGQMAFAVGLGLSGLKGIKVPGM